MTMNINVTQSSYPPTSVKSGSIRSGGLPDKPVSEVDPVKLTPGSQVLRQMEANPEPTVDEARVARIRQAVEDGSYPINPRQIAIKMSAFEAEVFRSRGR